MDKLKIFVVGRDQETLEQVPNRPFLVKVDLNKLPIGEYQNNQLAETRIFLSDLVAEPAEYIGLVSANHDCKHTLALMKEGQRILPTLSNLGRTPLNPDILYCCVFSHVNCKDWFSTYFEGIEPYLNDIENFSGLNMNLYPSLLANTFICHWDVFQDFLQNWRPIFDYIWKKYSLELLEQTIGGYADRNRIAGYLYEAVSMMVWADVIQRRNLNLQHFNVIKKPFKRILV